MTLEEEYRSTPLGPAPTGIWVGSWLGEVDSIGARRWSVRIPDWLLFRTVRFGVDFDRRLWWFVHPRLAAGRFEVSSGKSRWRDTEAYRLTYETSKLPVRGLLYDEVKPVAADRCLGLGGMNHDAGEGDHFFFRLVPL